jgi:hypothetical protein
MLFEKHNDGSTLQMFTADDRELSTSDWLKFEFELDSNQHSCKKMSWQSKQVETLIDIVKEQPDSETNT